MNKILEYESNDFKNLRYNENMYAFIDFDNVAEKMADFIFEIIDESDYFYFYYSEYELIEKYKQLFKYEVFEQLGIIDLNHCQENVHVFNIKSKESKKILKDNLRFNASDEDMWPAIIETNCKNIANDDEMFEDWIFFYKNDKVLLNLNVFDGFIKDYRKKELWLEKKGPKPRQLIMKKLEADNFDLDNQKVYSFKEFDNDVLKLVEFVYKMIDESDYFYYDFFSDPIFMEYAKKLTYEQIDILKINNIEQYGFPVIIFDIKSKEDKEFFKNNLRFKVENLENDGKNSVINITEDRLFDRTIYFIKNNKVKFSLKIINGLITDYRESKYWLKK